MAKISLHTLRAGSITLAADGALPTRLLVMPWGTTRTRRGKFVVNERTAAVFALNQAKMRLDGKLALDFEHNTLEGKRGSSRGAR